MNNNKLISLYVGMWFKVVCPERDYNKDTVYEITKIWFENCTCGNEWPLFWNPRCLAHYHFEAKVVKAAPERHFMMEGKNVFGWNDIGPDLKSIIMDDYKIVPIGSVQLSMF